MTLTAREIAAESCGSTTGDEAATIDWVATVGSAGPSHLAFVEDPKGLEAALASAAGIVLAGEFAAGKTRPAGALVVCKQPRLVFARLARRLAAVPAKAPGVHPTAVVDPTASVGDGARVEAHAVIDAKATIGARAVIGPGSHIGERVEIGDDTVLKANVVIYPGTQVGARVIVHAGTVLGSDGFGYVRDPATGRYEQFPQVGRLIVEDDVELGALCTVDRGALGETRIGRGTKLDNQVHLAHNVSVGSDVVISAQTGVAGSSSIGDKAVVAGQVGIADHVKIETGAILGAQCGVPTGKVIKGPGQLFWGTPARPIKQVLKEMAVLSRLAKK